MDERHKEQQKLEEGDLIRAIKAGGVNRDRAWTTLQRRYGNRLQSAMAGVLRDRTQAEDVVQEALLRAMKNIDRFEEGSSFYTWVYRIANNLAIDILRRQKRRGERTVLSIDDETVQIASGDATADMRIEGEQAGMWVDRAMAQLTPEQQEVLRLREFDDLSYKEIAGKIGIPVGTVMSRLYYARQALERTLHATDERRGKSTQAQQDHKVVPPQHVNETADVLPKSEVKKPSQTIEDSRDDEIDALRAAIEKDLERIGAEKAMAEERVRVARKNLEDLTT